MVELIKNHLVELKQICDKHHVAEIFLFGSATNSSFNEESDLDFLVQFNDKINLLDYADNFFSLIESLEKLFNRKVDLLTSTSLKNPILKKEIDNTKIMLYAA